MDRERAKIELMQIYGSLSSEKQMAIDTLLEEEINRDMEEIAEVIRSDADSKTKCKMISNILSAKPHYFEDKQEPCDDATKHEYDTYCSHKCDKCVDNECPLRECKDVISTKESDLIEREAVIDIIEKVCPIYTNDYRYILKDEIAQLPSVQPSQKEQEPKYWIDYYGHITPLNHPSRKGHWRDYSEDGYVECPFCEHATTCEDNIDELHYCFYCGAELSADMGGAE